MQKTIYFLILFALIPFFLQLTTKPALAITFPCNQGNNACVRASCPTGNFACSYCITVGNYPACSTPSGNWNSWECTNPDPWGPGCQNNSCLDPAAVAAAQAFCPGAFGISPPTPTPVPHTLPYGYSGMVCSSLSPSVSGWTCDANNFSTALAVDLYLDGAYYTTVIADQFRQDVVAANVCGGTGNHGFSIGIPQTYLNGGQHRLVAVAHGFFGTTQLLPNAGDGVQGGNAPVCMNATPWGFDAAFCGQTFGTSYGGWTCIQQDTSNARLPVNVYVDGAYYTTVVANQLYDNANTLAAGGWCKDNFHAMSVALPVTINNGGQHSVIGYVNNPNGNPTVVTLNPAAPDGQQGSHSPVCPNLNAWGFDGATCAPNATQTGGWACVPGDTTNARLAVNIYIDGAYYTTVTANQNYDPNNTLAAGGWCKDNLHAYSVPLPLSLNNGSQHTIQGYAYNPFMNTWTALSPGWTNAHTPVCQNMNPIGTHDNSTCSVINGWTCDPDNYFSPLRVDLYANGPAGIGTYIGSATANSSRPDVAAAGYCGGNNNTGFSFTTPSSFYDGITHPIYAYAINIGQGTANPLLTGSPKSLSCPLFTISGRLFIDKNNDGVFDGNDTLFGSAFTVTSTTNNLPTYPSTGNYLISGVLSGDYIVTLKVIPSGYFLTTNQSRLVHVVNGNAVNVDFGISNVKSWWQTTGLDVRVDSGILSDIPPSPAACVTKYLSNADSNGSSGVIFSGNTTPSLDSGSLSVPGWHVGTQSNAEFFKITSGKLQTAYTTILSNVIRNNNGSQPGLLPGCFQNAPCTISSPNVFSGSGIFRVDGNLTIAAPQAITGNYTILVHGNVTINGTATKIRAPLGNSFILIASGDITIDPQIGTPVSTACAAFSGSTSATIPGQGDLEGFYSADKHIYLNSSASCSDLIADSMLFMQGAFVSNASQTLSGNTFINARNLCSGNLSYPSYTIIDRPDMVLNFPDILKSQFSVRQEVAP